MIFCPFLFSGSLYSWPSHNLWVENEYPNSDINHLNSALVRSS
ncbi:hypothetical protein [Vibrio gallaecicus]|nr:hypothetical protein [Vibrio gallaecicus]MDN3615235.1 hypothetical protein [Vibrio gallaecicus]